MKKSSLPQKVEARVPTSLPDRPIADGRDRDRAERLADEVRHLSARLGKLEKESRSSQDSDPLQALFQSGVPRKTAPKPEDEQPEWIRYESIADVDETEGTEAGDKLWNRVKDAAVSDVIDGRLACKAVRDPINPRTPYEDLVQQVTYDLLVAEWQPSGMSELLLVQHMAQAQALVQIWTKRSMFYLSGNATTHPSEAERIRYGEWVPPRLTDAQTIELRSR